MSELLEFGKRTGRSGAHVFVHQKGEMPSMLFNFPEWNQAMSHARDIAPTIGKRAMSVTDLGYSLRSAALEDSGRVVEMNTYSGLVELMNSEGGAGI